MNDVEIIQCFGYSTLAPIIGCITHIYVLSLQLN